MALGVPGGGSSGLTLYALLLIGVVFLLATALVGVVVIAVVANRAKPDPSGRRPYGVYVFATAFATLWTTVLGSLGVLEVLMRLIGRHPAIAGRSLHPFADSIVRQVTLAGLVTVIAGLLLARYLHRGRALVRGAGLASTPIGRVGQSYAGAVSFLAVLVGLISLIVAGYAICQLIAPGIFNSAGRVPAVRSLIEAGYLVLVSGLILASHRRLFPPQLRSNPMLSETPVAFDA